MTTDEMTIKGSALVAALESAYADIRDNHPELPGLMFITGTGIDGYGLRWGHFRHDAWDRTSPVQTAYRFGHRVRYRLITRDRIPELFISGERLAEGAELTFQTLLHEAAHALGAVRKVRNVNGQGRHLKEFVELAEQLGLVYPLDKAHGTLGYSQVVLTPETKVKYADTISRLRAEITVYLDTLRRLGIVLKGGGTEGKVSVVKAPRKGADRNAQPCECQCTPPVRIMVARKTWAEGRRQRCEDCGELFHPRDMAKMEDPNL